MNKYSIQLLLTISIIILFILDKSVSSSIQFFEFFSITLVCLLILVNIKTKRTFIFEFFIFGLLCEWYNRAFLGTSILVSIIALYLFYVFKIRFNAHKALMSGLNMVFAYILSIIFVGFDHILDIKNFAMSILVMVAVSYLWLKE